ncbi:MAG: hypothetical protein U9Q74_01155 [Gemmatimonadota bacterium]|nr:hypothetical protein [Gemmatimonadota bacterium]
MKKKQQHRGEAFRRVQQYLDAHPEDFGAVNASDGRQQLDAALTELDTAVRTQLAGFREVRGERLSPRRLAPARRRRRWRRRPRGRTWAR